MPTEQKGPFYIERNREIVVIRSHQPFRATIVFPMLAQQQGAIYALQPIALSDDMKLVLSTAEYSDVVVDGGNGGAA